MQLENILSVLSGHSVNFVVVGGYAAAFHGSTSLTRLLHICYDRTPENMEQLASALLPHHPQLRGAPRGVPFVFDARTLSNGMNFTLQTDLGDVDLLGRLDGVGGFAEVARDSVIMELLDKSTAWHLLMRSFAPRRQQDARRI